MNMNRFFIISGIIGTLAGCAQNNTTPTWAPQYSSIATGAPAQMIAPQTSVADTNDTPRRMAVLLPLTGQNAAAGTAIRTSIEMAVLENAPQTLNVSFYDTAPDAGAAIRDALTAGPQVIIGPLFANNARILRTQKPETIPALAFTSDADAVGGGVMTMSLMPTNSVEAIVGEMSSDAVRQFIIMAPDNASGHLMAGAAMRAAQTYGPNVVGIFYYTPGDADAIKEKSQTASMYAARTAANTRARAILADILTTETLSAIEKSSLNMQLEKISKSETIGRAPYDAVLFLGNGDDTKKLASFLRYYGIGARDARFYGTAMWDGSDITSDLTMSGAKYAVLPEINETFANVYELSSGAAPSRLASFGYDAANMAIGMLYSSNGDPVRYLMSPNGYMGADGLVRMRPNGTSERALSIMQLDGSGTARVVREPATNFITPIYSLDQKTVDPVAAMDLQTAGINPTNYIQIPERLRSKYKSKTYGANMSATQTYQAPALVAILPEDDSDAVETADYQTATRERVGREYIDSVEIEE